MGPHLESSVGVGGDTKGLLNVLGYRLYDVFSVRIYRIHKFLLAYAVVLCLIKVINSYKGDVG